MHVMTLSPMKMDLSSALKVLRDATLDTLWEHRQEIEITLVNISKRLRLTSPRTNCSDEPIFSPPQILDPSSSDELFESDSNVDYHIVPPGPERRHLEDSEHETISESHSSTKSESSQGLSHPTSRSRAKDWPSRLLAASADDLPWLCTFLRKDPTVILDERKRELKDERIRDIQLVEGMDHPGKVDRIFRGLAQRSMGLQFTRIQQKENIGQTRVDELCDSICATDPKIRARIHKRTNSISKHLHHFTFSPDDKGLVLRSINAGVKQLVVEKLFERRLQESGRLSTACGISAIAALNFSSFKSLRFEDIPLFIDLLFLESSKVQVYLDSTAPDSRQVGTFQIADILIVLSSTFSDLQRHYNQSRCSMRPQDLELPARPAYFSTASPQTPEHETSSNAPPTTPSSSPSKRRRLDVSAASLPRSQDHSYIDTQSAESEPVQHGNNPFDETDPRLSNYSDPSRFSRSSFPATGYCDLTYVGQANYGHCYQLPENSDASAWSNFVSYCLPRVEDEYAWAAWGTHI